MCAQTAKTEIFLKPEDVGAHKYVWQITPQHDEIVVFYTEEWVDNKMITKEEELLGTEAEGKLCTLQVLYIDGGFFDYLTTGNTEKASYGALKFPGGAARLDNYKLESWHDSALNPGKVTLPFVSRTNPKDTRKYIYNVYVESYAALKQRYPAVPPLEELRTISWVSQATP